MDFLNGLNPQQQQAVTAGLGPVLVLAGPGSGKTRVLTQRIAYLMGAMGVRPYQILAVTFTNKAAREMATRVIDLLNIDWDLPGPPRGLFNWPTSLPIMGTFHSFCGFVLRREAEHLPFESNFVIFDTEDQLSLVKRAIEELNLDEKRYRPQGVHASISNAKNELILPDGYPVQNYRDEVVARVYRRYQELLLANNALDFDDLLLWAATLLEENQAVRERYARRFEHILVDEFQDTNLAQYTLLKHLASIHRNLYVVGDTDQCLPAGTSIQTPEGPKPIETLQPGECVTAAAGRGASMPALVTHVEGRDYHGDLVRVVTRSGCSFLATPNHIVFARLGINPDVHYVYLMYRKDRGYRIGIVVGARSDGMRPDLDNGLKVRANQEHADRIWILRACNTRDEACYWEQFYAFQYGIPAMVFHVTGRSMRFSQENINRLYQDIDTAERAERLLEDLGMDVRFPHYIPRSKLLRHAINLRYFGDGRRSTATPWNAHRIDIWGSDAELKRKLEVRGYHVRKGKRQTWRVGFSRLQFDDAQALVEELSQIGEDLDIVSGAFLTNPGNSPQTPRFSFMPASHLHPSFFVTVERDGEIVQDEIVDVTREPYEGKVFDLEVADVHNYIANGVVVHNSIYRWRGADYRNVLHFEKDYPDTQVVLLEQNYRSTQAILDVAMAVIDPNPFRTPKRLFTDRGEGVKVTLHEARDDRLEASFVVDTIATLVAGERYSPGDFAVMYRTNAQSRLLEEAFLYAGLPYKLVGAQRFYGRREIKDVIAYLRLVHNPNDEVSLTRVINVPVRGIGAKTILTLRTHAQQAGLSPGKVLLSLGHQAGESRHREAFPGRTGAVLANFGSLLYEWRGLADRLSPLQLMDRILEDIDYQSYLGDGTEEGQERWENVLELRRLAAEFEGQGLEAFLEQVALVSDQDTLEASASVPTLLTLHAAKGLEFPVVFIVGLNDGTLPHSRSFDDPESMQEERRLMYVGVTRAMDRLYLLLSQNRSAYGHSEPGVPSRFLEDIPMQLLEADRPVRPRKQAQAAWSQPDRWQAPSQAAVHKVEQRFKPGLRVQHNVWGEGMVLNSRVQDDDEIVDIFFEDVGLKRVAASLAKLEVIQGS